MSIFAPETPKQGDLLPGIETKTSSPLAGFWPRFFALLIDCIAFYAVGGMLMSSARVAMLRLNPWLPYLGLAIGFLYFLLANGPVGRGRTIGLAVLGLHVVGRNGDALGWPAAFKRTLLQFAGFYGILNLGVLNPIYSCLAFPPDSRHFALLGLTLISLACMTLLLALALTLSMHPYKQGWHDLFAGSYVTTEPTPPAFGRTLAAPPDPLTARKLANHLKTTIPFWLVSLTILAISPMQQMTRGDIRAQQSDAAALDAGALAGSDLTAAYLSYPSVDSKKSFEDYVRRVRTAAVDSKTDVPTTETLRAEQLYDGQTIMISLFQRTGVFPAGGGNDPGFQRRMTALREEAWPRWKAYQREWKEKTGQDAPDATQFLAVAVEQGQFLFYNSARTAAIARGPADPGAGPLTFQDAPKMGQPLAQSATTSSTAARQP